MSNVFFSSDFHFYHTNIIKFSPERQIYSTIEEHNEGIIDNINKKCTKRDMLYVLGDCVFGKKENLEILSRIKPVMKLIAGNHDVAHIVDLAKYFSKVYGVYEFHRGMILTHVPVHPMQVSKRYAYNIHGHLHSNKVMRGNRPDNRYFNACLEQTYLEPIAYEEMMSIIKYREQLSYEDTGADDDAREPTENAESREKSNTERICDSQDRDALQEKQNAKEEKGTL